MATPIAKAKAPFNDEQLAKLKQRQADQKAHPYTCGKCEEETILNPTQKGLVCPVCNYIQKWVHSEDVNETNRGRPTKYDPDYHPKAVIEYLKGCVDKPVRRLVSHSESSGRMGESKSDSWQLMEKVNLPTLAGLSLFLNVAKSTILLWAETHPEFSSALETIKAAQEERLLNKGISGHYNSTIAKLILSSNHGYSGDKQEGNSVVINIPEAFAGVIQTNTKAS